MGEAGQRGRAQRTRGFPAHQPANPPRELPAGYRRGCIRYPFVFVRRIRSHTLRPSLWLAITVFIASDGVNMRYSGVAGGPSAPTPADARSISRYRQLSLFMDFPARCASLPRKPGVERAHGHSRYSLPKSLPAPSSRRRRAGRAAHGAPRRGGAARQACSAGSSERCRGWPTPADRIPFLTRQSRERLAAKPRARTAGGVKSRPFGGTCAVGFFAGPRRIAAGCPAIRGSARRAGARQMVKLVVMGSSRCLNANRSYFDGLG